MANEHSQIVPSMQPTAKVADFKFWCQKVLPLVYDDSLSYYEVLNKMVVYLNQVIDNINADIDNVAELEDDFLLLQTYVNNFFDDIDQLVTYTERAEAAQTAAATSAINAATSASNAATSAVNAASSSGSAATSALSAIDAKDAAVAAKTAAETALANAQTAATNAAASATAASGSATNAAASATAAQNSFTLADAARVAAQSAANDAETAAELIDMDATISDIGKALIVKTVGGGKVTAYEFGESGSGGGGAGGIVNAIENVPIASFDDGTDAPVVELIVEINPVQSGSGDPTPDNVRPISGWTGAKIIRAGKNLLNPTPQSDTVGTLTFNIDSNTKKFIINGTNATNVYTGGGITKDNARYFAKAGTYAISWDNPPTNTVASYLNLEMFTPDGTKTQKILYGNNANKYITFTMDEDFVYDWWMVLPPNTYENFAIAIQFERGSIATVYEPFNGTTYNITFPLEAGTVYGGTLTNLGTGVWILSVDRKIINANSATWQNASPGFYTTVSDAYREITQDTPSGRKPIVCNIAKYNADHNPTDGTVQWGGITNNGNIIIRPINISTLSEWETYIQNNTVQIVYYVANPVEYTITTSEVIELLSGNNNILAETGNINLLKYIANGKKYVDEKDSLVKALIAKELDSMIADTNLVANDFRIANNTLYKITANIASGGTLTPGTNCVATTIGEVLKTLLT